MKTSSTYCTANNEVSFLKYYEHYEDTRKEETAANTRRHNRKETNEQKEKGEREKPRKICLFCAQVL